MDIRNNKIAGVVQLQKAMRTLIPNDSDFKKAFAIAKVSKGYLARYYLQVLERQARNQDEPELVPNANEEEINLEHILPQTPVLSAWSAFDIESATGYVNRLGNLALMRNKENSLAGNEAFMNKVLRYKRSDFKLTLSVSTESTWTPQSIDKRQAELADLAVKAWPL